MRSPQDTRLLTRPLLFVLDGLSGAVALGQASHTGSASAAIPMGTTKGERYNRLVIQNAAVISGRGEPGTNRAMPPESPVDLVVENGIITNMIPNDAVNIRNRGTRPGATAPISSTRAQDREAARSTSPADAQRRSEQGRVAAGDKVIDATGMYVIPGLVEMHAHLAGLCC